MTNLEKLKKAIIKEIPEIVELKLGCLFEFDKNDTWGNTLIVYNEKCVERIKLNIKEEKYKQYKIIGRPIKLADVLRVVWIVQPTMEITDKDRVDFGAMVNVTEERAFEVVQEWNLSKNNLDLQSKGTIDFLTNLICKDE